MEAARLGLLEWSEVRVHLQHHARNKEEKTCWHPPDPLSICQPLPEASKIVKGTITRTIPGYTALPSTTKHYATSTQHYATLRKATQGSSASPDFGSDWFAMVIGPHCACKLHGPATLSIPSRFGGQPKIIIKTQTLLVLWSLVARGPQLRRIPICHCCAMAEKIAHTLHPQKLDDTPEWSAVEVSDDVLVADKWQGNTIDRSEMRMLGRVQVLRV